MVQISGDATFCFRGSLKEIAADILAAVYLFILSRQHFVKLIKLNTHVAWHMGEFLTVSEFHSRFQTK